MELQIKDVDYRLYIHVEEVWLKIIHVTKTLATKATYILLATPTQTLRVYLHKK
jgi:hypothetical protein